MPTKEKRLQQTREEAEKEALELILRLTDEQIAALMKAFRNSRAQTAAPGQEIA